jgi:hypothetical protein
MMFLPESLGRTSPGARPSSFRCGIMSLTDPISFPRSRVGTQVLDALRHELIRPRFHERHAERGNERKKDPRETPGDFAGIASFQLTSQSPSSITS